MNLKDLLANTLIGVFSGIITYLLIGLCIKIFKNLLIPWFQSYIYRGHNIKGEWYGHTATVLETGEYEMETESESTINLKQIGNKITGELLLTMQPDKSKCRKLFELDGSFVDTILVLNTKVKNSNNMGTGSIIMKLTENGQKLKGKHVYISSHDWSTVSTRCQVWERNSK